MENNHSNATLATEVLQSLKDRERDSRKVFQFLKEGYHERYPETWNEYVGLLAEDFSEDAQTIKSYTMSGVGEMAVNSEEIFSALTRYCLSVKKMGTALLSLHNMPQPQRLALAPLIDAMVDYAEAISLLIRGIFSTLINNRGEEVAL